MVTIASEATMLDDRLNGLHTPDRHQSERRRRGQVVLERGMPRPRIYRLLAADRARKRD